MAFINVQSNEQLDAQIAAEDAALVAATPPPTPPIDLQSLAGYLNILWEKAKRGRVKPERQMLRNLRARNGEYEPEKLAAIKAILGADYDPIFMKITETKCRAAESWIKDVLFQPGQEPWDIRPTPMPELPPFMAQMIQTGAEQAAIQQVTMAVAMGAIPPDIATLQQVANELAPQVQEAVRREIQKAAQKAAEKMRQKILDQFAEGGWNDSLERTLFDLCTYGTAILKGPSLKRQPVAVREMDPMMGSYKTRFETRIIPTWSRVNPLTFYPSPDATADSLPWYFEKLSLSRKNLSDLLDVPGYNPAAIREVLQTYMSGGLVEWTNVDQTKAQLENRDSISLYETELIDCLEFGGTAPGKMLLEWGMDPVNVPDPEREYDIIAWLIGRWVIKAMLNPNQLGQKPIFSCGFSERPDSFWHKGVPELIEHIQNLANACARAIFMNIGIASGPQVELNTDRVADGENEAIYPWKVWRTTSLGMMESPAVKFYQPNIVTEKLLEVYKFCMEAADDDSGVPRYVHTGETRGGGAGETASGLSMLMGQAAKGIKGVIKNMDRGLITKSVEAQYYYNLIFEDGDAEIIGDLKVVAKGSSALINKEQQTIRRTELLERTLNPLDSQILGLRGRAELLRKNLEGLDIDPEKVVADEEELERMAEAQRVAEENAQVAEAEGEDEEAGETQSGPAGKTSPKGSKGNPPGKPRQLDKAGSPVAGRDHQLFESRAGAKP